jgi:hypothetical protein
MVLENTYTVCLASHPTQQGYAANHLAASIFLHYLCPKSCQDEESITMYVKKNFLIVTEETIKARFGAAPCYNHFTFVFHLP